MYCNSGTGGYTVRNYRIKLPLHVMEVFSSNAISLKSQNTAFS